MTGWLFCSKGNVHNERFSYYSKGKATRYRHGKSLTEWQKNVKSSKKCLSTHLGCYTRSLLIVHSLTRINKIIISPHLSTLYIFNSDILVGNKSTWYNKLLLSNISSYLTRICLSVHHMKTCSLFCLICKWINKKKTSYQLLALVLCITYSINIIKMYLK